MWCLNCLLAAFWPPLKLGSGVYSVENRYILYAEHVTSGSCLLLLRPSFPSPPHFQPDNRINYTNILLLKRSPSPSAKKKEMSLAATLIGSLSLSPRDRGSPLCPQADGAAWQPYKSPPHRLRMNEEGKYNDLPVRGPYLLPYPSSSSGRDLIIYGAQQGCNGLGNPPHSPGKNLARTLQNYLPAFYSLGTL